jgi:hypothetical protein
VSFTAQELADTKAEFAGEIRELVSKPTKPDVLLGNHPAVAFRSLREWGTKSKSLWRPSKVRCFCWPKSSGQTPRARWLFRCQKGYCWKWWHRNVTTAKRKLVHAPFGWDIYPAVPKAIRLCEIEAADKREAIIEKAAKRFTRPGGSDRGEAFLTGARAT